jgi:DNA-binding CsgD family transcriptional regulator
MSRSRQAHLAKTVEAIYRGLESTRPSDWLQGVLEPFEGAFGAQLGGYAHAYDLRGPSKRWTISTPIVHKARKEVSDAVRVGFSVSPPAFRQRVYGQSGPAGSFSQLTGTELGDLDAVRETSERTDVRDVLFLNAANPERDGLILCAHLRRPRGPTRAELQGLTLLAAHVAAAYRILRAGFEKPIGPCAIFESDGRLAHVATGHEPAVPRLRARLVAIDRARARMGQDPEAALEAWRALLDGRYSLFDRFESDGRRYVIASVNRPEVTDPRGLTEAEAIVAMWAARGHSEKLIAYELGVAPGTVSSLLVRAYRKLGVQSRTQLVAQFSLPERAERATLRGSDVMIFSSPKAVVQTSGLSVAEEEVARAAAQGQRNRTIARARGVSETTVAKQLLSVYRKLGITTRAELARLLGP